MERLFLFVYQNRAFFTFLALELSCAWLIVTNNQYQGAKFFNSSNGIVATMNNFSQGVRDYFQLREVNQMLAEENAALKQKTYSATTIHRGFRYVCGHPGFRTVESIWF